MSLSLHWRSSLVIGGGLLRSHVPMVRYLRWGHQHLLLGASPIPGLWDILKIPFTLLLAAWYFYSFYRPSWPLSCLFTYLVLPAPPFHSTTTSQVPLPVSHYYPAPPISEIQASSLGPSFLVNFFGSVGCILGILKFMANIYLPASIYHDVLLSLGYLTDNDFFFISIHLPVTFMMSLF